MVKRRDDMRFAYAAGGAGSESVAACHQTFHPCDARGRRPNRKRKLNPLQLFAYWNSVVGAGKLLAQLGDPTSQACRTSGTDPDCGVLAELRRVFDHKSFDNYELIQGDIIETVPRYVKEHPALKVALLHIDVTVYEPTRVILEHLYDKVVKGGLVLFDDFGTVTGESRAIDEFFAGKELTINKLSISHIPAYLRK
jgi:hypothetical protein